MNDILMSIEFFQVKPEGIDMSYHCAFAKMDAQIPDGIIHYKKKHIFKKFSLFKLVYLLFNYFSI